MSSEPSTNNESAITPPSVQFINELRERTSPLHMSYLTSGTRITEIPASSRFEIALVGRSNVGKSSLLNFMAGQRQLARVSSTPGRTQMINIFSAERDIFHFVDLPGYGYAVSPREAQAHWAGALEEYFSSREGLVGVLFLVDSRRDIVKEDADLCRWLTSIDLNVLAVQTKCDKVNKSQMMQARLKQTRALGLPPGMIVSTSVEKRTGLSELWTGVSGMLERPLEL